MEVGLFDRAHVAEQASATPFPRARARDPPCSLLLPSPRVISRSPPIPILRRPSARRARVRRAQLRAQGVLLACETLRLGLPTRVPLAEIDAFVTTGLMSARLLSFLWRATALAPADYGAARRMLLDAGVLLELVDADARTKLLMPMRMPAERPAAVAAAWPAAAAPPEGAPPLGVVFDLAGARLPPGVIERCVGSLSALKGWRPLECWRHGVLLSDTSRGESAAALAAALLELTSSELRVELRASAGQQSDAPALQQLLAPLVGAVERVLSEYPGFVCDRKQL